MTHKRHNHHNRTVTSHGWRGGRILQRQQAKYADPSRQRAARSGAGWARRTVLTGRREMWTNNPNFQDRNIYYHIFTLYNQHIRIEITNGNQWKPMETNEHLKLELEKISRVISVELRNFFRLQWVHQDDPRCTKSPPKELQSHRATSALRT